MSDTNNGAGPPSLRDIAEAAYDDLEAGAEVEAPWPLKRKEKPKSPLHPTTDRAIKAAVGSPSRRPSRVKQSARPRPLLIQPRSLRFPRPVPLFLIQPPLL